MKDYEIIIQTVDRNNPGMGNCAYYAFSLGLIDIIQEEAKQGKRQLFERWISDQTLSDISYNAIVNFDLDKPISEEGFELLSVLQQSLRVKLFNFNLEELNKICDEINEEGFENSYSAFLNNRQAEFENAYTKLTDNRIVGQFLSAFNNAPNRFNIFSDSEVVSYQFQLLRALIESSGTSTIAEPSDNDLIFFFRNDRDSLMKSRDFQLRVYYDAQRAVEKQQKIVKFFFDLYTNHESLCPEQNCSPIIQCMNKVTENYLWGNDYDLKALAKAFEINLDIYENGSQLLRDDYQADRYTISLNNYDDIHWTTQIITAQINSSLSDETISKLKNGVAASGIAPSIPIQITPISSPTIPAESLNKSSIDELSDSPVNDTTQGSVNLNGEKDSETPDMDEIKSDEPITENNSTSPETKKEITPDILRDLVSQVNNDYIPKTQGVRAKLSFWHPHGKTGRIRANNFVQEFSKIEDVPSQLEALGKYLSDNSKGNTNPSSFRTMLLTALLNKNIPEGKKLSYYDVSNKHYDHCLNIFKYTNNIKEDISNTPKA